MYKNVHVKCSFLLKKETAGHQIKQYYGVVWNVSLGIKAHSHQAQ